MNLFQSEAVKRVGWQLVSHRFILIGGGVASQGAQKPASIYPHVVHRQTSTADLQTAPDPGVVAGIFAEHRIISPFQEDIFACAEDQDFAKADPTRQDGSAVVRRRERGQQGGVFCCFYFILGAAMKAAETERLEAMLRLQAPVPWQSPLQPPNVELLSGAA